MGYSGRDLRISRDGTPVAGARSDNFTLNGEPVDITDKDDGGWRTLLATFGVKSASGEVSGIMKDGALAADIIAGDSPMEDHTIAVADLVVLFGDFKLVSYAPTGAHDGAVEFSATLESSGALAALLNTVLPAVTGTVEDGETLTTTNGTWLGSPSFARQWQFNDGTGWANIGGATNLTYIVAATYIGDTIRCRITATTAYGSLVAYSNIVGPVAP
jgi:TP901-1 family phage major tail protein